MFNGLIEHAISFTQSAYEHAGWWGVFGLMAIESACIPFPSEVIMPLAGWFLVEDRGHGTEYLFIAGFFGASSIERLAVEPAIEGQARAFTELSL